MFVSGIDMTIVNVALPDISRDLGAEIDELQWVLDGFLVTLGALLLGGSGLADRFGRRRVFLIGLSVFAVASTLAALARTPLELIGARVLMGAAVAGVMPPALSLLAVMFPPQLRPRAVGIWSTVAGAAIGLGPVLGGLLVARWGWGSVFLVNVPVALLAVPAGLILLPESRRPGTPPLDLVGLGISTVGLGGLVFSLIAGPEAGWSDPAVLGALVAGLGCLAAFVALEARRRDPLLDVRVLPRPRVACGAIAILAMYASLLGLLFLLPQYLQYVQDRSTTASGLALLPLGLGLMATSPLSAAVLARLGPRRLLTGGLCAMAAASLLLIALGRATPLGLVVGATALFGLSLGLTIAPATAVIMNDLGSRRAGDGAAVNQLARQVGGALGVAMVGSVFAAAYRAGLEGRLEALRGPARSLARESIEGAARVAGGLTQPLKADLLARADQGFDAAARLGVAVCGAMLLAAAAVALFELGRERR